MGGQVTRMDEDRERALAEIRETYAGYAATGYGDRWASVPGGMRHVVAERDAWLARCIPAGSTVLDIGCGDGHLALTLAAAHGVTGRYVGAEVLPERVELARRRVPWGEILLASGDRLPLEDATVDAVAAITLLSSIQEPFMRRAIAAEVARVLRPGGRFVVYDLRYPSPRNPAITAVTVAELRDLFPGWSVEARSLGLLPPLARRAFTGRPWIFRALHGVPVLRPHLGAVLTSPR